MYVAVRDMTLRQAGYSTLLDGLRDLELDAIELALGRDLSLPMPGKVLDEPRLRLVDDTALTTLRDAYAQEGIHISGLLLANNFHAVDLEAELEWVAGGVRLGEALGVDAVRIDAVMTGQQELSLAERAGIYAEAVQRVLAAEGPRRGCLAASGPHSRHRELLLGGDAARAGLRHGRALRTLCQARALQEPQLRARAPRGLPAARLGLW